MVSSCNCNNCWPGLSRLLEPGLGIVDCGLGQRGVLAYWGTAEGWGGRWQAAGATGMSYGHPSFCSSLLNVAKYERIMQTPLHEHTHTATKESS